MKILEIIASLDVGGAESALAARLQHQPANFETTVLHGLARTNKQLHLPDNVRRIETRISRKAITKAVSRTTPDVVVIHNPANLIRYPKFRRDSITPKVVYVSHAAILSERSWRRWTLLLPFRKSLTKASKIVAVSRQATAPIGARHPTEIVHLGSVLSELPMEEHHRANFDWLQEARVRFLVLSRISSTKNLRSVLGAVSLLRRELSKSQAKLLIVGDGPEKAKLVKATAKLGITNLVRFSPATNAPAQFLRNADFLVISSFSEGGPLTAIEALLAGCNLITTDVGLTPELAELLPQHVNLISGGRKTDLAQALEVAIARVYENKIFRPQIKPETFAFSSVYCSNRFYQAILDLNNEN